MMKLVTLIGFLQDKLDEQRKLAEAPQAGNPHQRETYYINLETQLTFRHFEAAIKQLKAFGDDKEINVDHIKILTDLLEKRWERIKNTDAIYNITFKTPANVLCRQAAKFLSEQLDVAGEKNYLVLLMPTVKSWRNARTGRDFATLYLHNFLPSDDNKYCFEVGHLKEKLDGDKLMLSHIEDGVDIKLTANERERVMSHTSTVSKYYENVRRLLKSSTSNADKINAAKIELRDVISKESYARYPILSTYGDTGYRLLKSNLLSTVDEIFADREQLFDYISAKLLDADWKKFLTTISDEVLTTLINNGATLKDAVKSDAMYTGKQDHDKAVLFCLAEAYWRERAKQGNYTSMITGRLFGYDKPTKQSAIDVIQEFLTSGARLDSWAKFVEEHHKDLSPAINNGTVGYISAHIQVIEEKRLSVVDNFTKPAPLAAAMK